MESILAQEIELRAKLAEAWREHLDQYKSYAAEHYYIRINGNTFRPISIHPDNPCGSIFRRKEGTAIKGSVSLDGVRRALESKDIFPADHKTPGNDKPEHRMQAALICHAIKNGLSLLDRFKGFAEYFDELIFIADELPAGEIRADIVAMGGRNGKYFPVFIELKNKSALTVLVKQLCDAKKKMHEVQGSFVKLLSSMSEKETADIHFADTRLLIVWPKRERFQIKVDGDLIPTIENPGEEFLIADWDKVSCEVTFSQCLKLKPKEQTTDAV